MIERIRTNPWGVLAGLLLLFGLVIANNYRAAAEARADGAVIEMRDTARLASKVATAEARARILGEALRSGGSVPVVAALEAEARSEGIRLDAVNPGGTVESAAGKIQRWEFRVSRVRLGALIRFLERVERARGDLLVREVTIRKAPDSRENLEASVAVTVLVPQ